MKTTFLFLAISATATHTFLALGIATLLYRLDAPRDRSSSTVCTCPPPRVDPHAILRSNLFARAEPPSETFVPLYVRNELLSDAELAELGLVAGDVLLLVQGQPVTDALIRELPRWAGTLETIELTVVRPREGIVTREVPTAALLSRRSRSDHPAPARGCGLR